MITPENRGFEWLQKHDIRWQGINNKTCMGIESERETPTFWYSYYGKPS